LIDSPVNFYEVLLHGVYYSSLVGKVKEKRLLSYLLGLPCKPRTQADHHP
jgi:hypothetical protein